MAIVAPRTLRRMRKRRGQAKDRSHAQTKIVPVIFETLGCPDIIWNSAILLFIRPTVHIIIHSRLHLSFSTTLSIQKPSRKIRAASIRVSQRVFLRNRPQHSTPNVIVIIMAKVPTHWRGMVFICLHADLGLTVAK